MRKSLAKIAIKALAVIAVAAMFPLGNTEVKAGSPRPKTYEDEGWKYVIKGDTLNIGKLENNSNNCMKKTTLSQLLSDKKEIVKNVRIIPNEYNQTIAIDDCKGLFKGFSKLESVEITGLDTSKVTSMEEMFKSCGNLKSIRLSGCSNEKLTNMESMFSGCDDLETLEFLGFNTGNVTNMRYTFVSCEKLTTLDLSGFNTAKVTCMDHLFNGSEKLVTIYVSDGWNNDSVEADLGEEGDPLPKGFQMFLWCPSLKGGKGTMYKENCGMDHLDYAHIDEGTSNPGFFTQKGSTIVHFNLGGKGTDFDVETAFGAPVSKPANPSAQGYDFGGWYSNKDCIAGTEWDFNKPITQYTVIYAKWISNTSSGGDTDPTSTNPTKRFTDVQEGKWYSKENGPIAYVISKGIMSGIGDGKFGPTQTSSRAQFVQIIYNMEGKPGAGDSNPFKDVSKGKWYYDAVTWAYNNNITAGTSANTFAPDVELSRETVAQLLFNYAKWRGDSTDAEADLSGYPDNGEISGWAHEAMAWANANKIVNGYPNGNLGPNDKCSRAEIAQMIQNYLEK